MIHGLQVVRVTFGLPVRRGAGDGDGGEAQAGLALRGLDQREPRRQRPVPVERPHGCAGRGVVNQGLLPALGLLHAEVGHQVGLRSRRVREEQPLDVEGGEDRSPDADVCHAAHKRRRRALGHRARRRLNVAQHQRPVGAKRLAEADRALPLLLAPDVDLAVAWVDRCGGVPCHGDVDPAGAVGVGRLRVRHQAHVRRRPALPPRTDLQGLHVVDVEGGGGCGRGVGQDRPQPQAGPRVELEPQRHCHLRRRGRQEGLNLHVRHGNRRGTRLVNRPVEFEHLADAARAGHLDVPRGAVEVAHLPQALLS
mmetsp:Transcript_54076/g.113043  ORF Transcript_54076/g.113043 Transcript_54076/m.113043 type:complete len:309 (+) Transcript_54076:376-1302(+)